MLLRCLLIVLLNSCISETIMKNDSNGFGYELLVAKLEHLEIKFMELLDDVKQEILTNRIEIKRILSKRLTNSQCSQNVTSENNEVKELSAGTSIASCELEPSKVSGQYLLAVPKSTTFEVYCEQTLHGGGWIVIQNRFDGSVDFYRNWAEYKEGFGRLDGEFWLGLDKIHLLTSQKPRKLLVHLEDFFGIKKYAIYSEFAIGNESEQYVLSTINGLSGTLEDSFMNHRGYKFTTKDVDNDQNSKNCAVWFQGAWWYTPGCYTSNLNGMYKNATDTKLMCWYGFANNFKGLKVSKMMIK